jgi:biotin transport system substrate-specific component
VIISQLTATCALASKQGVAKGMSEATIKIQGWTKAEKTIIKAFASALFAFATILAAEIHVPLPFTPIPMTLQTFIVPLAGGFLGAFWGTASMVIYLVLGLAGLNVFAAAPGGWNFLVAPSAGYVIGFIFASFVMGTLQDRNVRNITIFVGLIVAHLIILAFGMAGLMINLRIGVQEALTKGVSPFLFGDLFKLMASFAMLASYNRVRQRITTVR